MDKLPFPKSRAGWYVALVTISALFGFYYFFLYKHLSQESVNFLSVPREKIIINDQMEVKISTPECVSNFDFVDMQISVFNRLENESIDVVILLAQNNNDVTVMLRMDGEQIELPRGSQKSIAFGDILPKDTKVKTIGIKTEQPEGDLGFVFSAVLDGDLYDQMIPVSKSEIDSSRVVIYTFLRRILLPPWSNGFIPALVLFTTHLLEDRLKQGKPWGECWSDSEKIREKRILRKIGKIQSLVSLRSWGAVFCVNFGIVILFFVWVKLNSSISLVGFGCMALVWCARWIAGEPEKQDDDFYCGLNCAEPSQTPPPTTAPPDQIETPQPSSSPPPVHSSPGGKSFVQPDIQALLSDVETGIPVLRALSVRTPPLNLPEFERYLRLIDYSDAWIDVMPEIIAKTLENTSMQELRRCELDNPVMYQSLFDLAKQTPRDEFVLSDGKNIVEALAEMNDEFIIELLRSELKSPEAVEVFLPGLLSTNRSISERIKDFESIQSDNQPAYWLDTFREIKKDTHFSKEDIPVIQAFIEKGRKRNFPGYPLVEKLAVEDRQRLLHIGTELSKFDPDFADFFIYKELCYLPDSLDEIFLEKIREIGIALKNSQTDGLKERMKCFIHHNWQNKHGELPQKQPSTFARKFRKANSA